MCPFRLYDWSADPAGADVTALYLEWFMNYGITPAESQGSRPISGLSSDAPLQDQPILIYRPNEPYPINRVFMQHLG
jgi:hypothetical protein